MPVVAKDDRERIVRRGHRWRSRDIARIERQVTRRHRIDHCHIANNRSGSVRDRQPITRSPNLLRANAARSARNRRVGAEASRQREAGKIRPRFQRSHRMRQRIEEQARPIRVHRVRAVIAEDVYHDVGCGGGKHLELAVRTQLNRERPVHDISSIIV